MRNFPFHFRGRVKYTVSARWWHTGTSEIEVSTNVLPEDTKYPLYDRQPNQGNLQRCSGIYREIDEDVQRILRSFREEDGPNLPVLGWKCPCCTWCSKHPKLMWETGIKINRKSRHIKEGKNKVIYGVTMRDLSFRASHKLQASTGCIQFVSTYIKWITFTPHYFQHDQRQCFPQK